jgi:hypothetical protein
MAVKMAVVNNLVAVKGLQVAVNFGEGGSEGLPRSGNPAVWHLLLKLCKVWDNILNRDDSIPASPQPQAIYLLYTHHSVVELKILFSIDFCDHE